MFVTINFIIAMVLAAVQFIYFWFILSNKPVKIKEIDTLRSVRQTKAQFFMLVLTLGFISIIFFYICILNQLIIGIYEADVFIFLLVGVPVIEDRIKNKEDLLKRT